MTDQNIEQQTDRILDDLWSSAAVDTINTIQKTKPKNSTYVSDNFWQAKKAILALISKQVSEARDDELLKACEQWEKDPARPATYLVNRREELKQTPPTPNGDKPLTIKDWVKSRITPNDRSKPTHYENLMNGPAPTSVNREEE